MKIPLDKTRANEDHSWAAVVLGAVMKGAGIGSSIPDPIATCKRSYGMVMSQYFAAHKGYDEKQLFWNQYRNQRMASGQISWIMQKGDLIPYSSKEHGLLSKTPAAFTVSTEGDRAARKFTVTIMASSADQRDRPTCESECNSSRC